MKKSQNILLTSWIAILSLLVTSCGKEAKPVALTISSGLSLKAAMGEIDKLYTYQKPNVTIHHNFDNIGNLQRAIAQGAKVDIIFIPNAASTLDNGPLKELVLVDTLQDILKNRVILIAPKDTTDISNFQDLTSQPIKKIAVGDPKFTASGKYTQEIFKSLGILEKLKPKLLYLKSSADVVSFLENSQADAGIVLATDAIDSKKVKILEIAPENTHSPIIYTVAVLKNTENVPEAKEFLQFLQSDQAEAIFVKYGFTIAERQKASQ